MRHLILFRHAKANPEGKKHDDHARELAPAGRDAAPVMGRALAERGFSPDIALVSDAARCLQTWELACAAFPGARADIRPDLYLAEAGDLFAIAENAWREAPDASLMIVAHNPGLHDLALSLAGNDLSDAGQRLARKFSPGSIAIFAATGGYRLVDLLAPSDFDAG